MLSVRQQNENENVSQAPTLGGFGGVVTGQAGGQRGRGAVSGRGSGFTNLQSYIRANESNPNAQLIQQRTGQATEAQRQAQTGFETQAGQARGRLQGIQEQAGVVRSALDDPTKFVQTPENIKRITALRTGQEAIASPTAIQQNVLQDAEGLQSQRGQLASALQRDVTGTGLQEYLRSQRVNPALATAGENRLDRFLAEQTASGQQAIGGAMTEAERIAMLNQPEQVGQIGQLVSQVQENPLTTKEGILNAISAKKQVEDQGLQGINKEEVYRLAGIPKEQIATAENLINEYKGIESSYADYINKIQNINNQLKSSLYSEFNPDTNQRPGSLPTRNYGVPEVPGINFGQLFSAPASQQNLQQAIIAYVLNAINQQKPPEPTPEEIAAINSSRNKEAMNQLINQRTDLLRETNRLISRASQISQDPLSQKYKTFEQYYTPQSTVENVLQNLDPNRLARIRALEQITGMSFQPQLSRYLT
jgi:hypothetical protein